MNPDEFDAAWRVFVEQWSAARGSGSAGALLDRALADGLPSVPRSDAAPDTETTVACATALVNRAGALDLTAYRRAHATTKKAVRKPVRHFCDVGWKQLHNPRPDFDVWWYWNEHLDPLDDRINPLVHHLLLGRRLGLSTAPEHVERSASPRPDAPTKRAFLFAGQDPDGLVDDQVVAHLRELARHGDVHYLADATLAPGELDKISAATAGAWSVRHGRGRVGSWALLAHDLVGWETLTSYDEVLFVDDGAFLVRPFDEVFARMDSEACDWWGLHAVKHTWSRDTGSTAGLPIGEAIARWAREPAMNPLDHLHVGSRLVAYRRSVITDPRFQRRIESAALAPFPVPAAFGALMSHHLLATGHHLATFHDQVGPDDPAHTEEWADLIGQGHPLLERALLAKNPARVPGLADWRTRLAEIAPRAEVDLIERHLRRVCADDDLHRSFSVTRRTDCTIDFNDPLSGERFRTEDQWAPKFDHWWAFPVCAYDHTLAGNERAVFEQVRDDPSIKKIILTRSRRVDLTGENVVTVPLMSREGQHHLLRSRQIFVKHGPQINAHWPLSPLSHHFINLWHGIPIKRFGSAAATISDSLERALRRNNGGSHAVVTSSRMDQLAMTTAFWPLSYTETWNTGLPRNDFISCDVERLPADLRETEARLREEVGDRRLVMFLPTFKDGQADAYYRFTDADLARIRDWMERHHAVIGVREHMADAARTYWHQLAPLGSLDLSNRRYPDLEVLYRVAAGLVSDYSSCLVDFMLTGRPLASFAYDLEHYANEERGLFYDLDQTLPGPVCRTFDELADALDGFFDEVDAETAEDRDWRRRIFHDHLDDGASRRVVERVKALYGRTVLPTDA